MSAERSPLLFYCQPSLGIGHLARSLALCESLSQRFDVVLVCGGKLPRDMRPPERVTIVALPPITASVDGRLVAGNGSLDQVRKLRRRILLETFHDVKPETVLIEFFPFGKKRFEAELLGLLEAARSVTSVPVVACSVRDILVGRGHEQETFDNRASQLANTYFDAVIVHSDPTFARLEETFRPRTPLRVPLHYTGFVVPNGTSRNGFGPRPRQGVVVSAGGGLVGASLLSAAADAYRLLDGVSMTIIAGPYVPDDAWRMLTEKASSLQGLTLRRYVPDLGAELRAARASVSQCGYNTALDVLRAGVPALMVPFADNGEDEQVKRASRLQEMGSVRVLHPDWLEPQVLADEIRALFRFRPSRPVFDLRGGPNTVRVLDELHTARFVDQGR